MSLEFSKSSIQRTRSKYNRKNKNSQRKRQVVRVVKEIKKIGVEVLRGDEQQINKELVLKKEKIYIPKNKELRVEILWLHHDVLIAGYRE